MAEQVLNTTELPEYLMTLILAQRVRVREINKVIT